MRLATLLVTPFLLLATAAAQASAPDPSAGQATATAAPTVTPAADGGSADPNVDRGVLMPTAQTQPGGSFTITDYSLYVIGLTYGITDRLQVGAVAPIVGGVVSGTLKWQVLRGEHLRLSLLGGAAYSPFFGFSFDLQSDDGEDEPASLYTFGGTAATLCLDGCRSSLNASVHMVLDPARRASPVWLAYSGSAIAGLTRRTKLMVEYFQPLRLGQREPARWRPAFLMAALRIHRRSLAGDIGTMMLLDRDGVTLVPLPWINLSARFGS